MSTPDTSEAVERAYNEALIDHEGCRDVYWDAAQAALAADRAELSKQGYAVGRVVKIAKRDAPWFADGIDELNGEHLIKYLQELGLLIEVSDE